MMRPPEAGPVWVELGSDPLPAGEAMGWAVQPDCGAVVSFTGTVRDHSEGRPGVVRLSYEAYAEQAHARLLEVAEEARTRWTGLGRVVLLHRTGSLGVGEVAVVVVVSAPHRDEAFTAARWCIDTLKRVVPIWKREQWAGGDDWGGDEADIVEVADEKVRP